ncbi:MAG: hypothetical protein IKP95_09555 [Ruminococcus sp.]|nr:hypothetical protein [Ruminococcus sp.]
MGIDFYSETKTDEKYIECMVELFENGEYEPTDDEIAEYIKEVRAWL